jgi:hypothetical protein
MSIRADSPFLLMNRCNISRLPWPHAIAALLLGTMNVSSAQTAPAVPNFPTEFPADAQILPPQELQQRLDGRVYTARLMDGTGWRLDYRGQYLFVNVSTGASDKGKWRVEGSQMCTEYARFPSGCVEMRASANRVYLKRSSTGEVVAMDVVR